MQESTNSPERPPESNGQSPGSMTVAEVADESIVAAGSVVLETIKETFAHHIKENLDQQVSTEERLDAAIKGGTADRQTTSALRALHRMQLDRGKLLLNAIRAAASIDYKKPAKRTVREA
jgi:hypothetical protein